jgi:hypothetical protein
MDIGELLGGCSPFLPHNIPTATYYCARATSSFIPVEPLQNTQQQQQQPCLLVTTTFLIPWVTLGEDRRARCQCRKRGRRACGVTRLLTSRQRTARLVSQPSLTTHSCRRTSAAESQPRLQTNMVWLED